MFLVSKCLLGENCKYNGKNNECRRIINFLKDKKFISVCPECLGGLKIPRAPSEIRKGRVFSKTGEDVTEYFEKGADMTLKAALANNVHTAILKQGSPSCGFGKIYDGSFAGVKIKGNGITAKKLFDKNIKIITEEDFR